MTPISIITILLTAAALLLIILIAVISPEPAKPLRSCKTCRYYNRNCTQKPCIYCDGTSEWEKTTLEGQELD